MLRRLIGGSKFVRKLNALMEVYACTQDSHSTYLELVKLKPLIRTVGEESLYELNRASLLYDMKHYREAADIVVEIPSLNPEFDAKCAIVKTKIMEAL